MGGTREWEWCSACPQNSLLCQERSGTDPTQARPNPPTFAQGVISEYRCGWRAGLVLARSHPTHTGWAAQGCGRARFRARAPAELSPLPAPADEADQRQYEEWLFHTQQLLQMQLKVLEEQIGAHRKSRKALCAKQRTAKKAGREFPEADAEKLKLVTEQQSKIQKQLDQVGLCWWVGTPTLAQTRHPRQ